MFALHGCADVVLTLHMKLFVWRALCDRQKASLPLLLLSGVTKVWGIILLLLNVDQRSEGFWQFAENVFPPETPIYNPKVDFAVNRIRTLVREDPAGIAKSPKFLKYTLAKPVESG